MTDSVFTQGRLDALKKAYATGALRLTYDGKTTEFRSLNEMERVMNNMQRELDAAGGKKRSRQVRMKTSRGLDGGC